MQVITDKVEFVKPPVDLSESKLKEMKAYAKKLMAKYPTMKLHRIQRKTAEYFNIKIQ